jgi:hypothetical protein
VLIRATSCVATALNDDNDGGEKGGRDSGGGGGGGSCGDEVGCGGGDGGGGGGAPGNTLLTASTFVVWSTITLHESVKRFQRVEQITNGLGRILSARLPSRYTRNERILGNASSQCGCSQCCPCSLEGLRLHTSPRVIVAAM